MKRRSSYLGLLCAVLAVLVAGCGDDDGGGAPTKTPTPTQTPTTVPTATPTPVVLSARLELDVRWTADVRLSLQGSHVDASLTLSEPREVASPGVALLGAGDVHLYPEAGGTLYSAKFSAPAYPAGRCGSDPESLVLTLFRRGNNPRVAGGVAVYCGADKNSGTPARMLRLSGNLPLG